MSKSKRNHQCLLTGQQPCKKGFPVPRRKWDTAYVPKVADPRVVNGIYLAG